MKNINYVEIKRRSHSLNVCDLVKEIFCLFLGKFAVFLLFQSQKQINVNKQMVF